MNIISKLVVPLVVGGVVTCSAFAEDVATRAAVVDAEKAGTVSVTAKPAVDSVDIAKKLANPIANMISVPLQYEFSRGLGRNQGGSEQTLLLQPVMPFNLGGGDTFIVRPIIAGAREISVQNAAGQSFSGYGIANVTLESFYAPNTNSSWIWGIGPYAVTPSGNSGKFGSQQTGAGVTAVVLNRDGPWTYGALAYQSWNVGGNPAFGTQNNLFGEPFVSYTNKDAWTFTAQMQAQYNYDAHRTSNPLYAGISKLEVFDGVPVSFSAGPISYLSNTPGGPSGWGGRATVTLVILK
jgi:hypothetical protein